MSFDRTPISTCYLYLLPQTNYPHSHVEDSWVAFSDRQETYYLLTLNPTGRGFLLSQLAGGELEKVPVLDWSLRGYHLDVSLDVGNSNHIERLSCFVKNDSIEATILGSTGWKEEVVFRRLGMLMRRLDTLASGNTNLNTRAGSLERTTTP